MWGVSFTRWRRLKLVHALLCSASFFPRCSRSRLGCVCVCGIVLCCGAQDMYEQLQKVRDEQEADSGPFGASSGGRHPDKPRIILVSRRLPYKLQVHSRIFVFCCHQNKGTLTTKNRDRSLYRTGTKSNKKKERSRRTKFRVVKLCPATCVFISLSHFYGNAFSTSLLKK